MYYDIVESGLRIRKLRTSGNMTRQNLAERIGVSVDALRKIEKGTNGARIDTLVSIAELFNVSLDYLVCGYERGTNWDGLLSGLGRREIQFVRSVIHNVIENIELLRD